MRIKILVGALLLAFSLESIALAPEDSAIMRDVVEYLVPKCGGRRGDGPGPRRPALIDTVDVNGDTNRLARVLAELAQTNNAWYAEMAMWQLEKYGTSEQLPFLYSCATNPAVGDRAVKAVLRIEGVTSNSMAAVHNYLFMSNQLSLAGIDERSDTCTDLLKRVCSDPSLVEYRPGVLDMATSFIQNVELMPNVLDGALCNVQDGFRFSKRRLSILRSAMQRVATELSEITVSDCEREGKIHCYTFQTNYLQNAINELVAYPEANLPD